MNRVCISRMARYIPERMVSSTEMEKQLGLDPEWIQQRTGILQRFFSDEANSIMAEKAVLELLETHPSALEGIDQVICVYSASEQSFPSISAYIQGAFDLQCGGFDMNNGCTGFINALEVVSALIKKGTYQKILLITSERFSPFLEEGDAGTYIVFGDGSTAMTIEEDGWMEIGLSFNTHKYDHDLSLSLRKPHWKIHMDGLHVYRFAVKTFEEIFTRCTEIVDFNQLSMIIPHQSNARIIEKLFHTARRYTKAQILSTVSLHGNTGANSIPWALEEVYRSKIPVESILLMAYGSGLSYGMATLHRMPS